MNGLLFLDDIRQPIDAYKYTREIMFIANKWDVVKSYREFIEWIKTNGVPAFISFDHDLSDIHCNKSTYKEKTGYTCAEWLVNYCIDNNFKCPDYFCHSMNPVGKDKIIGLLDSFSKSQNISQ